MEPILTRRFNTRGMVKINNKIKIKIKIKITAIRNTAATGMKEFGLF